MGHDHQHADQSSYYLEQLCNIGICAAVGGVTIMLWKDNMLRFILVEKFHLPVLVGALTLLVAAAVRAVTLWWSAGKTAALPAHEHKHDHEHDHAHDRDHPHVCGHEHHHDHDHADCAGHDHHHELAEPPVAAAEAASSSDCGHDHGWNPWRYAILMLPVVLYFLNLPNSGFHVAAANISADDIDTTQVTHKGGKVGDLIPLEFKRLEEAAYNPDEREVLEGKRGLLKGQFAPTGNDRLFSLVRYKMTCCAADAVQLNVMILSPESIKGVKRNDWVDVTGEIQFRKRKDREEYLPVLQLSSRNDVKVVPPDPYPFLQ